MPVALSQVCSSWSYPVMTYDVPQTTNAVDSVEDVCSQYSQAFWLVTKQVWQNLSNAWSEFYKQIRYVTLRIIDVLRNSFDVLRNLFAIVIVCFSRKNCVLLSINCVLLSSSGYDTVKRYGTVRTATVVLRMYTRPMKPTAVAILARKMQLCDESFINTLTVITGQLVAAAKSQLSRNNNRSSSSALRGKWHLRPHNRRVHVLNVLILWALK